MGSDSQYSLSNAGVRVKPSPAYGDVAEWKGVDLVVGQPDQIMWPAADQGGRCGSTFVDGVGV